MVKNKDYYEVLGIGKKATAEEIKKAYRKAARSCHPDANSEDPHAEERFKELTEAYEILGDPEKRKLYDQYGSMAFDGTGNPREGAADWGSYADAGNGWQGNFDGGFGSGGTYYYSGSYDRGDIDDILKDLFSGRNRKGYSDFSDYDFSGFGGAYEDRPQRGADATGSIEISLREAVFGTQKLVSIQENDGKQSSLQIQIPPGMESGQKIRLKGKGGRIPGMPPGDLYVTIYIREDPDFRLEGKDIYTKVRIPFATAVLGGEAMIRTLDGQVKAKIREGTQSGTKIRLKGKGAPDRKNPSVKGDLYACVEIDVPRNLNNQAKEKLKEFQNLM